MTILIVETMEALRALPSSRLARQPDVQLKSHKAAGDGRNGTFFWDESSMLADNDDTVIQPDDVPHGCPGRLIRLFSGPIRNIRAGTVCLQLDLAADDLDEDTKPGDAQHIDRTGFWSW